MIKKVKESEKGKNKKIESLYTPIIYQLENDDLDISRELLEFLAENGDILTQPIFTNEEYKNLLKELCKQIKSKEILYCPHGMKQELKSCVSLFFDQQKFFTLIEILNFYKKIIFHDSELEEKFSHYFFYKK